MSSRRPGKQPEPPAAKPGQSSRTAEGKRRAETKSEDVNETNSSEGSKSTSVMPSSSIDPSTEPKLNPDIRLEIQKVSDFNMKGMLRCVDRTLNHFGKKALFRTITISPPLTKAVHKMSKIRKDKEARDMVKHIRFVVPSDITVTQNSFEGAMRSNFQSLVDEQGFVSAQTRVRYTWEEYQSHRSYYFGTPAADAALAKLKPLERSAGLANLESIELISLKDTEWGKGLPYSLIGRDRVSEDLGMHTMKAIIALTLGKTPAPLLTRLTLSEIRTSFYLSEPERIVGQSEIPVNDVAIRPLCTQIKSLSLSTKACVDLKVPFLSLLRSLQNLQSLELKPCGVGTTGMVLAELGAIVQNDNQNQWIKRLRSFSIQGPTVPGLHVIHGPESHPFRWYDGVAIETLWQLLEGLKDLESLLIAHMGVYEPDGGNQFEWHSNFLDYLHARTDLATILQDVPEFDRFGNLEQRRYLAERVNHYANSLEEEMDQANPLRSLHKPVLPNNSLETMTVNAAYEPHSFCQRRFLRKRYPHLSEDMAEARSSRDANVDKQADDIYKRGIEVHGRIYRQTVL